MSNQNSKKQLVTKKVNWRKEGINLRREVRNKLRGKKKKEMLKNKQDEGEKC